MEEARAAPPLVHHAVLASALRHPRRAALEASGRRLSYEELASQARDVAAALAGLGAGPESVVVVLHERSLGLGPAVLGVLASGAAYLPIDPSTPPERLRELAADARAIAVVTSRALAGAAAAAGLPVVDVGALPASRSEPRGATATDLAYLLYTSGSTGRPKGVLVEHRSLALHAHGMREHYALEPDDRVLQFASLAFDVAAEELFPTWIAGACAVLRDEACVRSFGAFTEFLGEHAITVANLPAGFWQEWTAELERSRTALPPRLRLVIAGSERVAAASLVRWKALAGERVRWINGYGPTETTITATTFEPRGPLDPAWTGVPVGFPLPWVRAHVVDDALRPVEPGAVGQLAIGGGGVARGYHGAPELSAERFVDDPFSREPGARLYLTGDRARVLADGALEFLGREDDQVKLRGYRIELGEIEARLAALPGVRAAAAMVREDAPGARQLAAYAVALDGARLDPEELRRELARVLPEHMLPAVVAVLPDLPRTAGGKLDRRALPAPGRASAIDPPRTATERLLAELWRELLGVEVGRGDHFFRLGGHSLLAMQLAGRLAEREELTLAPRAIFEHPTLAELAAAIDAEPAAAWPPYPPMRRADRDARIPLSASQEPVWFLLQLEPGLLAYNTQFSVRFDGPLDPDAMRRALARLVERHEVLRTSFHERDLAPCQAIHAPWEPALEVIDLEGEPAERRETRAEQLCAELCARRFDVGHLPLVAWTLLRRSASDWELVQVEHHFVHDGWSIAVLLRELAAHYHEALDPSAPRLPAPEWQFADYVAWQRAMLVGERRERLVAFWRERLAGAPPLLALPTDRPRPSLQTFHGASEVLAIPADRFRALADLARREGFTPFQLMLAAFELLLARHSGSDDVVIATAAANRRTRECEGVIGMIVNPVPIRVDCGGDPSFREFAARVRRSALESFEHQDLPFEHVVQALEPARDFSYNPIFQVLFSFHDSPVPDLAFGEATGRMVYRYNGSAKFDMNLVVIPRGEQRVGRAREDGEAETIVEWEYNSDLFDRERVVRMVGHFRTLLEGLEQRFDAPCSALPMLTEAERAEHARWNATEVAFPKDAGLIDLFREQVARTPDAPALRAGVASWTYAELAARADAWAAGLRERGVARGDLVGVCLERSADLVASLLAISSCGAAYFPLDPALPPARLESLVADAFANQGTPRILVERSTRELLGADLAASAIDVAELAARGTPSGSPATPARGSDLAYVIATSGSTGTPKGVEIEQSSLVNFLGAMGRRVELKRGDVLLAVTTLSFDIAGLELFLPLCSGACVVLATREQAADPRELACLIATERVTCLQATPATWSLLVESGWSGAPAMTALCGGEALSAELARAIAARTKRLWNVYGPTETTIWSTLEELAPDVREVTIGRPLDNTRLYVLDPHGAPLPTGVAGELWIGGAGVARGYRNRPELTAERFRPDPFGAPGERMYATGDRVRRLRDGRIEFLGRNDRQVKLRGFRIELGEIESVLATHAAVAACAVELREMAPGDHRLIAWVVPRGAEMDAAALRAHLARQLPEHMLPAAFVQIAQLPRTPNGKLDRKALVAASLDGRRHELEPPRGDVQIAIARIWSEVLKLERVGARDRFFDLGGHSLLAVRAIALLERELGVRIPARDLMLQNLSQLADAVTERRVAVPKDSSAAPKPAPAKGGLLGALRGLIGKPPA